MVWSKVVGDPDEVANQYSFDNAAGQKVSNDDVVVENPKSLIYK